MAATVDRVGMAAEAAVLEGRGRWGVEAVAVEAWAGMVAMVVRTVAMDMTAARGVAMEVMEATAVLEVMEVAAGSEAVGEAKVAKAAIRALEERWGVVTAGLEVREGQEATAGAMAGTAEGLEGLGVLEGLVAMEAGAEGPGGRVEAGRRGAAVVVRRAVKALREGLAMTVAVTVGGELEEGMVVPTAAMEGWVV